MRLRAASRSDREKGGGKRADQMSGVRTPESPASLLACEQHVLVELPSRHLGPREIEVTASVEEDPQVALQANLSRIISDDVGPAEVGLVGPEDRP